MNCSITLEAMDPADLDEICRVDGECFLFPWPRPYFESELKLPGARCVAAKLQGDNADGDIVAYCCIRILMDEMHLMRIAVAPEFRGRGVGLWILEAVCAMASGLGAETALLEVRESNAAAAALYEKAGFACCGKRPNYYPETREAALVMQKKIPRRHYDHENCNQRLWADRTSSFSGCIGPSFPGSGGDQ
ncbi:ribosomal protein S18-alanine N-acetyltransferase [Desulfatibacillum alkenivorans]|jgi:ribosomal-protein-alanine N-acetyltransferase|uniref:ribosomal protein S18-alanine N-acetyltransferase n=1 Tax=Desulfatibacillum alkenivorans TaxID=259354 RepID=UPI0009361854|nr:ribosomal protein S18-alanine N-acetyltransferase [Desulfatibacillum alkenivorans]